MGFNLINTIHVFEKYLIKIKNHSDIFGCLIMVYIYMYIKLFLFYLRNLCCLEI